MSEEARECPLHPLSTTNPSQFASPLPRPPVPSEPVPATRRQCRHPLNLQQILINNPLFIGFHLLNIPIDASQTVLQVVRLRTRQIQRQHARQIGVILRSMFECILDHRCFHNPEEQSERAERGVFWMVWKGLAILI